MLNEGSALSPLYSILTVSMGQKHLTLSLGPLKSTNVKSCCFEKIYDHQTNTTLCVYPLQTALISTVTPLISSYC